MHARLKVLWCRRRFVSQPLHNVQCNEHYAGGRAPFGTAQPRNGTRSRRTRRPGRGKRRQAYAHAMARLSASLLEGSDRRKPPDLLALGYLGPRSRVDLPPTWHRFAANVVCGVEEITGRNARPPYKMTVRSGPYVPEGSAMQRRSSQVRPLAPAGRAGASAIGLACSLWGACRWAVGGWRCWQMPLRAADRAFAARFSRNRPIMRNRNSAW